MCHNLGSGGVNVPGLVPGLSHAHTARLDLEIEQSSYIMLVPENVKTPRSNTSIVNENIDSSVLARHFLKGF